MKNDSYDLTPEFVQVVRAGLANENQFGARRSFHIKTIMFVLPKSRT